MTVSEVRDQINKVKEVFVQTQIFEDDSHQDLKVVKTDIKKHLKGRSRDDLVYAFIDGDSLFIREPSQDTFEYEVDLSESGEENLIEVDFDDDVTYQIEFEN